MVAETGIDEAILVDCVTSILGDLHSDLPGFSPDETYELDAVLLEEEERRTG